MRWQLQRPGTSRVAASGAEGVVSHEEPMEITIAVWLGVAVAIMAAMSASHARDLMSLEPGTEIERVASIGNKQLSLPAGKWEVVMSEADRRGAAKAGNVFLVRKAKGRLAAYLFVRTNLEIGSGTGWKRPRWCDRNNVHHNGSDNYYNKDDADCWMLIHRVFTNKMLRVDFYNRMKAYLRKHEATSTLVGNMYWRNDPTDFLLVSHFVDPAAFGFSEERGRRWTESRWHMTALGDGTPRRGFVDAVKAHGERYREAVRNGFRNRLGDGASNLRFDFQQ